MSLTVFKRVSSSVTRGVGGVAVVAGLLSAIAPIAPVNASADDWVREVFKQNKNPYQLCAAEMARLKVSPEESAAACGRTAYPEELGMCVRHLTQNNAIEVAEAVGACSGVRRPKEVGLCFQEIRLKTKETAVADILGNCRGAVLPERYGKCVVGLNAGNKVPPAQAMTDCKNAGQYPRELDRTFIPYGNTAPGSQPPR